MKIAYSILLTITWLITFSQNANVQNYDSIKKVFFPKDTTRINLMKRNWNMFFKDEVFEKLDSQVAEHTFEIKLDSYGSLYPEKGLLEFIKKEKFQTKRNKNFEAQSFYKLFNLNQVEIKKGCDKLTDSHTKNTYIRLLKLSNNNTDYEFSELWDSLHQNILKNNLNDKIKDDSITRIIFFVHGYNVPYSLASLQAITVYKEAKLSFGLKEKILFIPVYWPSNDRKKDSLSQENFSTQNIKKYGINGKLFLRYSNRCYMGAIALRQIINHIDNKEIKIDMIAHSLGAIVVTSCLINTTSKLDYSRGSEINNTSAKNKKWVLSQNLKSYSYTSKDYTNLDILQHFYSDSIPTRPINVFLSAAAIPGEKTFCEIDRIKLQNKKFYITINRFDEMVTKTEIRKEVKRQSKFLHLDIKAINAKRLGATTLGCNDDGDAYWTMDKYNKTVQRVNFFIENVSEELDHDIFTYIQQQAYKDFFKKFITEQ